MNFLKYKKHWRRKKQDNNKYLLQEPRGHSLSEESKEQTYTNEWVKN